MRITIPHNTTKDAARETVERRLGELESQYGHHASDMQKNWIGDVLDFNVKARGFSGAGKVEVTETEVIIEGKLPLLAKPFEPRIKSTILREAEEMFRMA